jgi:acetyl esterase/lipase
MEAGGWGAEEASPVRVLGHQTPPVFIAHGRDDSTVPIAQSEELHDHLTRLGVPVEYHETDGGHVFEGSDVLPDVLTWSLAFLGRHLGFDIGPHPEPAPAEPGARPAGALADSSTEDASIHGKSGRTIPIRIRRPVTESGAVVLYLHSSRPGPGGVGSQHPWAARLSAAVPATVVQVPRCLTAEHPSSADFDDCVSAVTWLHENRETFGGTRLVLAGDGAGGNLAWATAMHCRDHGIPVEALFLNCPDVDSSASEELRGLCPVIVGVGARDSHFEDTLRFAYHLRAAAVPTRLRIFPTLGNGYCRDTPMSAVAQRATERMGRDLGQLLWDGTLA